jgi:ABC-type transporter Mla MlaB component
MTIQLQLQSEQTIYQAKDTHVLLATALHDADAIDVDLSLIHDADTSFLQILCWLQKEGQRLAKPVLLRQPSESLCKVIQTLGMQDVFLFTPECKSDESRI